MKKIKMLILGFILVGALINLKPKDKEFQKPIEIKPIEEIQEAKITQNIPIPQEIQNQIDEKEKQRIQQENEEKQKIEQERIERERSEEEKKKQELAKLEEQKQEQQAKVTSRSGSTLQNTKSEEWIKFIATGYCNCSKCGGGSGRTAMGTIPQANRTVAMPKGYSFGTKIEIQGMGTYIVEDRGGAIKGNKIDIYFNSHKEALNFGKRTVYLRAVK